MSFHLIDFVSPRQHYSIYRNIPMANFAEVKALLETLTGGKGRFRYRYRGPRKHRTNKHQARSYCLKADATRFSVYLRHDWRR